MPFKSKSQIRKFEKLEAEGRMTPGTKDNWLAQTANVEALPDRVKPSQPTKAIKSSPPGQPIKDWYR